MYAVLKVVSCRLKSQLESPEIQEDQLRPDRVGHIIPVTCGHTGHPSTEEAYMMELHLKAAGFLDPPGLKTDPSAEEVGLK